MTTIATVRRAALWCLVPISMTAAACSSSDTTAEALGNPVAADAGEASSPGSQTVDETDGADGTSEVSWLASQTAAGGRIESTDGVPTRLVLDGIDAHTIMFSDRPDRVTDVADTRAFIGQWDELFADSAPNAVLVEHRPDGPTDSLVVVLTNPILDADARTLSYDIEVLADEDHPDSISGLTGEVHETAPAEFRAASLFIDSITYPVDEDLDDRLDAPEDDDDGEVDAWDVL